MLPKIKRWGCRAALPLLGLALLYPAYRLVEYGVAQSLDLGRLHSRFASQLPLNSRLQPQIRGIDFDLLEGIILKGGRIYFMPSASSAITLRPERIVLHFSLFSYLWGNNPIAGFRLAGGSWEMNSLQDLKSLEGFSDYMASLSEQMLRADSRAEAGLPIYMEQVALHIAGQDLPPGVGKIYLDLSLVPKRQGRLLIASVKGGMEQGGGQGHLRGEQPRREQSKSQWELRMEGLLGEKAPSRLSLDLHNLPAAILSAILEGAALQSSPSLTDLLQLDSAIIDAEGGLLLEGGAALVKLEGYCRHLLARIGPPDLPAFIIPPHEGHFKLRAGLRDIYTIQRELFVDSLSFKADGLEFGLSQRGALLSLQGRYSGGRAKGSSPRSPGLGMSVSFNIRALQEGVYTIPYGQAQLQNLQIQLPGDRFRINQKFALQIDELLLERPSAQEEMQLNLTGQFLGAPLVLQGSGNVRINHADSAGSASAGSASAESSRSDKGGVAELESQINIRARLSNLEVVDLSELAANLYSALLLEASEAPGRAGLGSRYGHFGRSALYRRYLKKMDLAIEARLEHLQGRHPIPGQALLNAALRGGRAEITSPEVRQEDYALRLDWIAHLYGSLPRHDLSFDLSLENNRNPLFSITGSHHPPQQVEIDYDYRGRGIGAGDLMRNSYSSLLLQAKRIELKDERISKVISHTTDMKEESLVLNNFRLVRNTDGPVIGLRVSGDFADWKVFGSGQYISSVGGKASYRILPKDSSLEERLIPIRFLPSGHWLLDI